jgi:uncharacterized protein (TIGR00251 family)
MKPLQSYQTNQRTLQTNKPKSFYIYVKPLSRISEIKEENNILKAYLKSPPIDGRANEELIYLLSRYFKVEQANIKIKSGKHSRKKLVQIC